MTQSYYIQEVRRLIGILKQADGEYKEEEDNAREIYESECNDANMELKTMNEKSGINLEAAKETFKNMPSHELLNDLDFKIHKKTIEDTTNLDSIVGVQPTNELKKNALIAIETSQKIDEQVKELRRLINVQKRKQYWKDASLLLVSISALIILFFVAKDIYTSWQLKSNYAAAIEALEKNYQQAIVEFEAKQWKKARDLLHTVLVDNQFFNKTKNYKNALSLLKESHFKLNSLHNDRASIIVFETIEFVWISGGCFYMGSPSEKDNSSIEEQRHEVFLDGFWMGKTEITNSQYRRFRFNHCSTYYSGYTLDNGNQPVVNVSWKDAKAFAEWLTKNNEKGYKFRLPTEAEWEYAAQAVTTNKFLGDGPSLVCKYANVADRTNKCTDDYIASAPVGSFNPNNFGLYDMMGNVWEFCEDFLILYEFQSLNPMNPWDENIAKIRGGAFTSDISEIRSDLDSGVLKEQKYLDVGFRLVMTE